MEIVIPLSDLEWVFSLANLHNIRTLQVGIILVYIKNIIKSKGPFNSNNLITMGNYKLS